MVIQSNCYIHLCVTNGVHMVSQKLVSKQTVVGSNSPRNRSFITTARSSQLGKSEASEHSVCHVSPLESRMANIMHSVLL